MDKLKKNLQKEDDGKVFEMTNPAKPCGSTHTHTHTRIVFYQLKKN